MPFLEKLKTDPLFGRVLRSSGKLLSANAVSLGLSVLQGIMVARLLAPEGLGLIRVVMVYASTVNSVLSFRMSELVVRYGGEHLAKGEKENASAVIKAASLAEGIVSLLAFLVVVFSAGLAEKYFTEATGIAWMFSLYALGLLASFNLETAIGILQTTHKIEWQGIFNLTQNILVTVMIGVAYFWNGTLAFVLIAYLLGKVVLGLGIFSMAQIQLRKQLGSAWWKTPLSKLRTTKELIYFAVSSNISATIIKIFRESELLWVALFLPTEMVGLYSVAYTIVNFVAIPADPLITTTFPEINRLAVQKTWHELKDFLRKITTLSFAYNLLIGLGFIFFGRWIILIYSGEKFINAYPALVALTIGLVFNYILFWNRPLLLSLSLPNYPIWVTLIVGLLKVALAFWLVPKYGIVAAGALLSFYYVASVGAMALRGVREIRKNENCADH
ncbi:MAG: oligosaccharide flippase family protein [Anaerolineales bacterium]|nr:oligosaccharide flippase family protein [Anaerolineales bacterium]